jgi:hypothetical protein
VTCDSRQLRGVGGYLGGGDTGQSLAPSIPQPIRDAGPLSYLAAILAVFDYNKELHHSLFMRPFLIVVAFSYCLEVFATDRRYSQGTADSAKKA